MNAQHFVLTRFNLRLQSYLSRYFNGQWKGGDEEYLRRRFDFFERFCLPSMAQQKSPFRWLVFFSELTPEPFRTRARSYSELCGGYEAVFVDDATPLDGDEMMSALDGAIARRVGPGADYVIISRIDNDDAFNVNALGWIRDVAERVAENGRPDRFYVVMPYGNAYIEKGGFTQDYTWDWNHFPTLVCRRGVVDNPFSRQHARIGASGIPVHRVSQRHAWLEIVNGTNAANDLRAYCRPKYLGSRQLRDLFAIQVKASRFGFALFWLTRYLPAKAASFLRAAKSPRKAKR